MRLTSPIAQLVLGVVALEIASGLPMGLMTDFVPVWARATGLSREAVGALGALTGLWSLKFVFAPLVDSLSDYRRWALGLVLTIASLIGLASALGEHAPYVLAAVAVLGGIQDVALDGWLVALVPAEQQGRVSGLRVAAYRVAMAIGGGGAVLVGGRVGWAGGWIVVVGALLVAGATMARFQRPVVSRVPLSPGFFRELLVWFLRPQTLLIAVFGVLYKLGDAAALTMTRTFWVDSGLSTDDIGLLGAVGGSALTAAGALVGGEYATRLGLSRALVLFGFSQLASNLAYAIVALEPGRLPTLGAGAFEAFTTGLGTAPLLALLMRAVGREQQGTRFAALTALLGLTRSLGSLMSGYGATWTGYAGWFALTAVLAVPGLLLASRAARAADEPGSR